MSERRIGVYVCHCGGNISDYVDVDDVVAAVATEPGVVVARTAMFTCSDATQQEIVNDIQEQKLDGIVVASCSPKLHTFTFREVAKRAGLNPYQYTQVNIREQCSWTHTDDHAGATEKAARLVRAGIARTRLTEPLDPIVVDTVARGGGHRRRHHRPAGRPGTGRYRPDGPPGGARAAARRLGGDLWRDVSPRQERSRARIPPRRPGGGASKHHRVHRCRDREQERELRQLPRGHPHLGCGRDRRGGGRLPHRGHRLPKLHAPGRGARLRPSRASSPSPSSSTSSKAPTARSSTTAAW